MRSTVKVADPSSALLILNAAALAASLADTAPVAAPRIETAHKRAAGIAVVLHSLDMSQQAAGIGTPARMAGSFLHTADSVADNTAYFVAAGTPAGYSSRNHSSCLLQKSPVE